MTPQKVIELEIESLGGIGHPALMQRFVLERGTPGDARAPWTHDMMEPHGCFGNCAEAMHWAGDVRYTEGYILSHGVPILVHHAWLTDAWGRVLEPTIKDPERVEYFGVVFDNDVVWKEMLRTGIYGLLDLGRGVNLEFLEAQGFDWQTIMKKVRDKCPVTFAV